MCERHYRQLFYKIYYIKNKELIRAHQKQTYHLQDKKEAQKQRAATYYKKNKKYFANYRKHRMRNNVCARLAHNIRVRLYNAMKGITSAECSSKGLGCTISELKVYLESKFIPGMSWNNYSFTGWHIDHIVPLSKFDLTDKEQYNKACHYTNLQPLWRQSNLSKGNRV